MTWKEAALKHAISSNNEVCGLISIVKGREKYFPCKNLAADAEDEFVICPDNWIEAEDAGELVGVFHSHPNCSPKPSKTDLISCNYLDLPFYIVNPSSNEWHVMEPDGYKQPLIGRSWKWGTSDCWTLVIDYFAEKGLTVKNWPRPNNSEDILTNGIFERLIPKSGFKIVEDEMQVGDLLLMKFVGPDPDHVAVYIGDQMMIHHADKRLSSRDLYNQALINATVRRYRYVA
tara:strand:+ start:380 stop:1072 length:693 start_codon:yes stop_codon:yes gene_type:complete